MSAPERLIVKTKQACRATQTQRRPLATGEVIKTGREWNIIRLRAQYTELSALFCEVPKKTFRCLGRAVTKSHYQLHRDWLALCLQRTTPFPQERFSQNFVFMISTKICHQILILVKMYQNQHKIHVTI
jgi:hypothetical protein